MEGISETAVAETSSSSGYSSEVATPIVESTPPVQETSPAPEVVNLGSTEQSFASAESQPSLEAPQVGLEAEDNSVDDSEQEVSSSPVEAPVASLEPEDNSISAEDVVWTDTHQEILEPEDISIDDSEQESRFPSQESGEVVEPHDGSMSADPEQVKTNREAVEPEGYKITTSEKANIPEQPASAGERPSENEAQPQQAVVRLAVSDPAEMAALDADAPVADAIEKANKPVGEQMRDTEKRVAEEVPVSQAADAMLKDSGAAANGDLVETIPSDVLTPVRADTEQNIHSDLAVNASRIETAQANAARNTADNAEAAAKQEHLLAASDKEADGSREAEKTVTADAAADPGRQDVSERYNYSQFTRADGAQIKQVSGQLGVPGEVETHRDEYQQRKMSGGSGDHASHLIGDQFGARGDSENLSSGNQHINLNSYKNLESSWASSLKDGSQIDATVKDVSKSGEDRPFMRNVKWSEVDANGAEGKYELDFANTHSPESRLKQNIAPTVPEGTDAEIIDLAEVRRNKRG